MLETCFPKNFDLELFTLFCRDMVHVTMSLVVLLVVAVSVASTAYMETKSADEKRINCVDICLLHIPSQNCRCQFQFFTKRAPLWDSESMRNQPQQQDSW